MKFFLSFAVLLVAILLYERFFPSAPINPVLPVPGSQKEVNGHNSKVPPGRDSTQGRVEGAGGPSTAVPPPTPEHS